MFFEGFELTHLDLPQGRLRLRVGGDGPPLLLLHGNPQTHAMWHAVAPTLARRHRVVCPDLRGYGGSFKPPPTTDHAPFAKTEMARDMVMLMQALGHERFGLVGHDRGGRVGHRLCLDHPGRVEKFAVLDIVPTLEHFERTDMSFALGYYHWFWFAQPHPKPEALINAAPRTWFEDHVGPPVPSFFHPEAVADYIAAIEQPEAITGMCEDYRAAASIDLEHDRISRAEGRRIRCPVLVLWGAKGRIGGWYDPVALWQSYADGPVSGGPVEAGHYLAEEAPEEVLAWLTEFLG